MQPSYLLITGFQQSLGLSVCTTGSGPMLYVPPLLCLLMTMRSVISTLNSQVLQQI